MGCCPPLRPAWHRTRSGPVGCCTADMAKRLPPLNGLVASYGTVGLDRGREAQPLQRSRGLRSCSCHRPTLGRPLVSLWYSKLLLPISRAQLEMHRLSCFSSMSVMRAPFSFFFIFFSCASRGHIFRFGFKVIKNSSTLWFRKRLNHRSSLADMMVYTNH